MTVRKQVDEPTRIAVAKKVCDLLDELDADGKKKLTQTELGKRLGVSQEAARRARDPDGVTPAIVKGMRKHFRGDEPIEAMTDEWGAEFHRMHGQITRRFGLDTEDGSLADEATALLIRKGVGLREAERAVGSVREFKHEAPLTAEAWAEVAYSLVIAFEKHKSVGQAPTPPHPKKPPKVGR